MNFCTKCQSIYAQPGTCNCYARTAPPAPIVHPAPLPMKPYIGDPMPGTTWIPNVTCVPATTGIITTAAPLGTVAGHVHLLM